MLESLFSTLCKIGALFRLSWNRIRSPSTKNSASTISGVAAASSGDHSPVHIGDQHIHLTIPNSPTTRSESEDESKTRFNRRLLAVAHELPTNFRFVGNAQNPFQTQALEKLVHDEPRIHEDPELFQKAIKCLNTARILSTSSHPNLKPADGQFLMKDLAQYVSEKYGIKGLDQ